MKALVLAGGSGTRLRPLSHTIAKQLIPVANKPVLLYGLEAISDAGIEEVGVIVGDREPEIREVVGDGRSLGLDVTYIRQDAPLGLAHAVLVARDYLAEDDFVMYLGDNVVLGGITSIVDEFRTGGTDATLMVAKVQAPEEYGVAEVDAADRVLSLEEKSTHPRSDLAIVGVYVFSPAIHQAVRDIEPSRRGEREITDAVQWLVEHGADVRAHRHDGYWMDTGRAEQLLDCNRVLLGGVSTDIRGTVDADSELVGPVIVEPGARVVRSHVVGPAIVGPGATVTDSYVGPNTSLGASCRLEDAGIEQSVVLEGTEIRAVRGLTGSLIGRRATVAAAPVSGHSLLIGDHSQTLLARDVSAGRK